MSNADATSFLGKHEFLLRRLHSLTGLVPVGAYMCVHLATNASLMDGVGSFQRAVYLIHSLGDLLPLVEWTFIFLPIIFHALLGMVFIWEGKNNLSAYNYAGNIRYTLQRVTGVIAFIFIFWHVFHLHGWFHAEWWMENIAKPLGGGMFKPYSAGSTLAEAFGSPLVTVLYGIGVYASIFHFANGLWTMGITWGLWVTPEAQKKANVIPVVAGVLLFAAGTTALVAVNKTDPDEARVIEDKMYEAKLTSGEVKPEVGEEKRAKESSEEEKDVSLRSTNSDSNTTPTQEGS